MNAPVGRRNSSTALFAAQAISPFQLVQTAKIPWRKRLRPDSPAISVLTARRWGDGPQPPGLLLHKVGAQIPFTGVRKDDNNTLSLVFRTGGDFSGGSYSRAGGNSAENSFPASRQSSGCKGFFIGDLDDLINN